MNNQHEFHEIVVSTHRLNNFEQSQGLYENSNIEILELRHYIFEEIKKLIPQVLTTRQQQIINLLLKGYTQQEIGDTLGITQICVAHSINGRGVFNNGIYNRLIRAINNSPHIIEVLNKINSIHGFKSIDRINWYKRDRRGDLRMTSRYKKLRKQVIEAFDKEYFTELLGRHNTVVEAAEEAGICMASIDEIIKRHKLLAPNKRKRIK